MYLKGKRIEKRYIFSLVMFTLASLTLILNSTELFIWTDSYWTFTGKNGGYSLDYWFAHISYWSLLFLTFYFALEIAIHDGNKQNTFFEVSMYFASAWSFITFLSFMPQYPFFVKNDVLTIFTGVDHKAGLVDSGVPLLLYCWFDLIQVTMIHMILPLLTLAFLITNRKTIFINKISKKTFFTFLLISSLFMFSYYIYAGIETLNGAKPPYPIIDWRAIGWPIYLQAISIIGFYAIYNIISIVYFYSYNKKVSP